MAQLNQQQYQIGRLPWIEVDRGDPRLQFARLDLSLIPDKSRAELEGVMAENGISSSRLPGQPGYLQVALADQSGKNLDILRMASVNWASPASEATKLYAVGNGMHSPEFLNNAQNLGFNPDAVLDGLKKVHSRYGVELDVGSAADGRSYLVAHADQALQLSELRDLPLSLDNLPYDHVAEAAKVSRLAESKPSVGSRALAGGAFGVVASAPAILETYQIAKQEIEGGKVPVVATNYATKFLAEAAVGSVAGGTAAVAATPLLAIPPPAGEIAYGAAVLGAGYLGAEGTRQLMEQADYYAAKAKAYFSDDQARTAFEGQIRVNAEKNGQNPEVVVALSYKMIDDQVNKGHIQVLGQMPLQSSQGLEP